MANLYLFRSSSVKCEIDFQIKQLRTLGIQPTLVRLSDKASAMFAVEVKAFECRVSRAPKLYAGLRCLCHIIYRDPTVRWVKVEGVPKDEFKRLCKNGSPLEQLYGI